MNRPLVAITIGRKHYRRMFSDVTLATLGSLAEVIHHEHDEPAGSSDLMALLANVDACITSWGVAGFDTDVLATAPGLRAVAHMGSSVKRLVSDAFWERGIHLTSAGPALARDVAETTLGLMIAGRKGIFALSRRTRDGGWEQTGARELSRCTVGIVGASNVGRHLMSLLKAFEVDVICHDPFLSAERAAELGVEIVGLDDLVARSDIVSLHCPANASTKHMFEARRLAALKDGAILINTARGSLIDETALISALEQGRIFAFLDVTDPEPPADDSPLRRLPNVVLTPHIAGCIENCHRLGELAVEELRRFFAGEPPVYWVTREMLDRIA